MLPNKKKVKGEEEGTILVGYRMPAELVKSIEDIFYTERYPNRTEVAIELIRLGLAARQQQVQ